MKLGLINSAWAQAGKDTAYGIRMTREIGFDTIDIFTDPLDIDVKERRLIKRECDKAGLPIVSIACVAVGLIDFNPSVQRFHLQRCRAYLDLAYEYEAKNVLLVIGEYIWEKQVIPPAEQWQTGVKNLRELGQYAADLGVQIALELEPFKLSLVRDVDSMVRFLNDVNHPAVKANIDVSHLLLSGIKPEELRRLKGHAIHVHISDCDGKVHGDLPPGRGVVDFPPYLHEIKALGIDGAVSIELEYSPEPDQIVAWVREAYQATDRLLQAAQLRGAESGEPRAESGEPRAESGEPRAESGERRAKSGEPSDRSAAPSCPAARSGEPRAESGEPRAESGEPSDRSFATSCPAAWLRD